MPVDKFGRMSDTKTTDSGVSLTYINNNYVRSDGGTPLTGSLDMKGNIIYNVAEPVNPQDVATKVYVDNTKGSGVIGRRIGDSVSIKENMDFMGKQKIKNLPGPVNDHDAATKEYVDTKTELGNIDMEGKFTVLNVKTPINDNHITDKKYVDDNAAFVFRNNEYYAKGNINLRNAKLGGLREPTQDGEATTKKYVDDSLANHFIDGNDNIVFGRDVDMEGNKIFALPEPDQDSDPATKKYVDDLQNQYIDKRGNLKFGRNINLDNKRIFALKDPKKDYEATNKKYVDDSITKRLQEEKDKFLPKDPATKEYVDEAIKGLAGGNILVSKEGVFIKDNGHYRATAPLDIDNHKMENLPKPLEDGDAVNKKYVDEIVEDLTLKQGLIRENGGFNLVDSYINMSFNNIRNVGNPIHGADAVPRSFVDGVIKELEEKMYKTIKEKKQLIAVHARYCGALKEGDFPFKFGGNSLKICEEIYNKRYEGLISGFVMPHSGRIKKIICEGFSYVELDKMINELIISLNEEQINMLKLHFKKDDFKNDLLEKIKSTVNFSTKEDWVDNKPLQKGKTFFEIVKATKFKDRGIIGSFLNFIKISYIIVVEKFEWYDIKDYSILSRTTDIDYIIMKILSYDIETKDNEFKEGDTLNIRVSDLQRNLFKEGDLLENILTTTVLHLFSTINFNFTFLIELDPL